MSHEGPQTKPPSVETKISADDIEPRKRIASKTDNSYTKNYGEEKQSGVKDRGDRNGHTGGSNTLYGRRFFIIKSLNHQNIQLSIEKGIWATQVMNEPILDAAFHNSDEVILIFSVNMSGFFQGYARMTSSVGWRRDNVWGQGSGRNNPWGRSFKVKWLRLSELPFERTLHLKNPLNDYKPVKISRDCQELTEETGQALCQLLDEYESVNPPASFEIPSKRHRVNPVAGVRGSDYCMPPLDVPWVGGHMVYPSPIYQNQAETNEFQTSRSMSHSMIYPDSSASDSPKSNQTKQPRSGRSLQNGHADHTKSPRIDSWDFTAEMDPLCTLSEDDFLKMSYEEYLEAYYKSSKQLERNALGNATPDVSGSRTCGDDMRSHPDGSNSHKRQQQQQHHDVSSYK